jgi:Sporulation and spore germination/Immunoglobulin-like domain of bacterial spore germination
MPKRQWMRAFPLLVALMLSLGGTIGAAAAGSTPEPSPTGRTMTVSAYFLREARRGEMVGTAHRQIAIPEDKTVAKSAMTELLKGPSKEEKGAGLKTAIPKKTKLNGINLVSDTKVATVDLSKAFATGDKNTMEAQVAQVVYTLTQFPTIEKVSFKIDGNAVSKIGDVKLNKPVGRADFDEVTPLIFVESPAPFDEVTSPLQIIGTANTFEATFQADIISGDVMLAHEVVTATSGSGTRGTFDTEIPFDTADAAATITLKVYELSAKDGSVVNQVEIPLKVGE